MLVQDTIAQLSNRDIDIIWVLFVAAVVFVTLIVLVVVLNVWYRRYLKKLTPTDREELRNKFTSESNLW